MLPALSASSICGPAGNSIHLICSACAAKAFSSVPCCFSSPKMPALFWKPMVIVRDSAAGASSGAASNSAAIYFAIQFFIYGPFGGSGAFARNQFAFEQVQTGIVLRRRKDAELFQNAQRGDLADLASRRTYGGQAGHQQRREWIVAKADDGALFGDAQPGTLAAQQRTGGQIVVGEDDRFDCCLALAHALRQRSQGQRLYRLLARVERRFGGRYIDMRFQSVLAQHLRIAIAAINRAQVAGHAVLHEGDAAIAFVQ